MGQEDEEKLGQHYKGREEVKRRGTGEKTTVENSSCTFLLWLCNAKLFVEFTTAATEITQM